MATAQTAAWISIGTLGFGVASVATAAAFRTTRFVTTVFVPNIITTPIYPPVELLVYGLAY